MTRTPTPSRLNGPTRVLHVITGLDVGGAEVNLHRLLATLDPTRFEAAVVSLTTAGVMAEKISTLGIPVHALGLRECGASLKRLQPLFQAVSAWRPQLIQGWMYDGNVGAWILSGLMRGRLPVVWNVRHSLHRLEEEKTRTRWVIKAGALISRHPKKIIYNSCVSAKQHERLGYHQRRTVVIPNGFHTGRFTPSDERRRQVRHRLGISEDAFVVGMVARYHPIKDHDNFLEAAKRIRATRSEVVFLLAGRGVTLENAAFEKGTEVRALGKSVRLLGEINNVPSLMAALDVLVSASTGEGFPNVVGEAMAVGLPCVVTDVGDSAMLVGEYGFVVNPRDTDALAAAVEKVIDMGRGARVKMGLQARNRIVNNFSLERSGERYAELYQGIL